MAKFNPVRQVKIPYTGRIVTLAEAKKAMGARESWLGQPRSLLRKKILAQRKDFERLERAVEEYNQSGSFELAGRAADVSRNTAKTWVLGKKLPKHVSILWSQKMMEKRKPLAITQARATPFAYVLGAMMGDVSRNYVGLDSKQGRLNLSVQDEEFARHFSSMLHSATGIKTKVANSARKGFIVDIGSRNIIQLFNELSMYGTRIPEEFPDKNSPAKLALKKQGSITSFLQTKEERVSFVQALYDSIGNVKLGGTSKTKVIMIRPRSEILGLFIAKVLKEQGLHPKLWKGGFVGLPSAENALFMQKIGFRKKIKNWP